MDNATTCRNEWKLELANTMRGARAVGAFYGVGHYVNGCRRGWALEPQESRARAENLVATATTACRLGNQDCAGHGSEVR